MHLDSSSPRLNSLRLDGTNNARTTNLPIIAKQHILNTIDTTCLLDADRQKSTYSPLYLLCLHGLHNQAINVRIALLFTPYHMYEYNVST